MTEREKDNDLKVATRLAEENDLARVCVLIHQVYGLSDAEKRLKELIGNGSAVVITEDSKNPETLVLSVVCYVLKPDNTAFVAFGATHPDYREKGLSRITLQYLISLSENKGLSSVWGYVKKGYEITSRLLELGFEEYGEEQYTHPLTGEITNSVKMVKFLKKN